MAETSPVANFYELNDYKTVVYDTHLVPDEVWSAAQSVHRESLRALLPKDYQFRADYLIKSADFLAYRDSRVDPNKLVGTEWNDDQLFRRPKFAATYDRSNQLVGGVLTADNTSSRLPLPKSLRPLEYWAKMLIMPGITIPVLGNRRYDHLREVYTHPDAQEHFKTDAEDTALVSGIALAGIYYSIKQVDRDQMLVAYPIPSDPVDAELTHVSEIMGMGETGYRRPHSLPGYSKEAKQVRVTARVADVMRGIIDMPGAKSAIEGIHVSRITNS